MLKSEGGGKVLDVFEEIASSLDGEGRRERGH